MGLNKHICEFCGKEYEDYFKDSKYCSKECYRNFRKANAKLKEKQCPICGKWFKPHDSSTIYCSKECSGIDNRNRTVCICDNCGEPFERIKSEVDKNKKHFCSKRCMYEYICWTDEDKQILTDNYGRLSYKEISELLNRDIKPHSIHRMAMELGLTENHGYWTDKEIDILIKNYPTKPMSEVMRLLPYRSRTSILGQARIQNLKSYFYLNRIYTDDEINYLKENYASKSYEEMSKDLGRTISAIKQRMIILGLRKPTEIANYKNLHRYIRQRIVPWRNSIREKCNYVCAVTGKRSNIIVHHIRSFNLLLEECIEIMDFPLYEDFGMYTQEQLDDFLEVFLELQEHYGEYVCITENVHKKFHSIYGCGNNTKEQWEEFVDNYNKQ
jgi:endogenous inhibitor of DNA gyrase (YacG/DUF329 family)